MLLQMVFIIRLEVHVLVRTVNSVLTNILHPLLFSIAASPIFHAIATQIRSDLHFVSVVKEAKPKT